MNSTLTQVHDAFHSGYFTAMVQRDVAKEFKLAGMFPKHIVDSPNVVVTQEWKGEEVEEQVKGRKKKLAPKGTDFRKIRAKMVTPDGFGLEKYGIELDIELRDMIEQGLTVQSLLAPITKYLAREIDNNVYEAALASARTMTGLTNNWSSKDIKSILADMITLRNTPLMEDDIDLTNVILGQEALNTLQIKSADSIDTVNSDYVYPHNGFTIKDTVPLAGMTFSWGGRTMNAKELIAFQSNLPALELFYLKPINNKVHSVPSINENTPYVPEINVLQWDNSERESEPIVSFQFTTSMGTYAPELDEDGLSKRIYKISNVVGS